MAPLCYLRHRFSSEIIQHAIWLYLRFTLGYRDVEEPLAERGLDISYETVRRWVLKFGPGIARRLRRRRPRPSDRWHLDVPSGCADQKIENTITRFLCWSSTGNAAARPMPAQHCISGRAHRRNTASVPLIQTQSPDRAPTITTSLRP